MVAAAAAGVSPVEVLVDASRPPDLPEGIGAEPVEAGILAEACELAHPPRAVAVYRRADLPRLDPASAPPTGLALWRVADPGNLGTLLRAADALGPAFVALSHGCADPTGSKALRASAGAVFRVPLGDLDAAPGSWVGLVPQGGEPIGELDLPQRVTFVVGAEREGLPPEVLSRCEALASIPQAPGAESLNAAMAGGIALYERCRRERGQPGRVASQTESSPPA